MSLPKECPSHGFCETIKKRTALTKMPDGQQNQFFKDLDYNCQQHSSYILACRGKSESSTDSRIKSRCGLDSISWSHLPEYIQTQLNLATLPLDTDPQVLNEIKRWLDDEYGDLFNSNT